MADLDYNIRPAKHVERGMLVHALRRLAGALQEFLGTKEPADQKANAGTELLGLIPWDNPEQQAWHAKHSEIIGAPPPEPPNN